MEFKQWHEGYPVKVAVHPVKGRQMIATRDIKATEPLLSDSPYCWIIDEAAKDIVCQNCFLEKDAGLPDFIPCTSCKQVYYCTEECRNIDSAQHCMDECEIFKNLEPEEYSAAILTELKLLVRTLSRKSVEMYVQKRENGVKTEGEGGEEDGEELDITEVPNDNGLRYPDYCSLVSNRENFPKDTVESLEYWICDYVRRLGEWVGGRKEDNIELLDILLRNRCNAFYIQGRFRESPDTSNLVGTSRGCGIYVRNSFFNHSCAPNVNYWVVDNSLKVECTASNDVKEGEELCISYIDTTQSLEDRRAKLLESYLFKCDCSRCMRQEAGEDADEETKEEQTTPSETAAEEEEQDPNKI